MSGFDGTSFVDDTNAKLFLFAFLCTGLFIDDSLRRTVCQVAATKLAIEEPLFAFIARQTLGTFLD